MPELSTRPYLLRAIFEWCNDSGFTPYISVMVDEYTRVPPQFVSNGQIVLNISHGATSGLMMGNDAISFKARFGGVSREIYIPVENVVAIYASESGEGMAFEPPSPDARRAEASPPPVLRPVSSADGEGAEAASGPDDAPEPTEPPRSNGRPSLTRIK
ncbi:MAG: ClpXP protease specificity-enhancing factor [Burkholderiaceae bacterium]|nr:ClpXP protease specificity-enhancing factor [Burkholderiaceae bacterium]